MYTLEVPRIYLKGTDFVNNQLSRNSSLWIAVHKTVKQEIRRIQQATQEVFEVVNED